MVPRFRSGRAALGAAFVFSAMIGGAACQSAKGEETPAAPRPVLIGAENVIIAKRDTIVAGPIISGELRPEREAVLRAQLGGSMLQVRVEGRAVGTARRAARPHRNADARRYAAVGAVGGAVGRESADGRASARWRAPQQLVTAGALAARELDLARNNVTSAEAQLADARVAAGDVRAAARRRRRPRADQRRRRPAVR